MCPVGTILLMQNFSLQLKCETSQPVCHIVWHPHRTMCVFYIITVPDRLHTESGCHKGQTHYIVQCLGPLSALWVKQDCRVCCLLTAPTVLVFHLIHIGNVRRYYSVLRLQSQAYSIYSDLNEGSTCSHWMSWMGFDIVMSREAMQLSKTGLLFFFSMYKIAVVKCMKNEWKGSDFMSFKNTQATLLVQGVDLFMSCCPCRLHLS